MELWTHEHTVTLLPAVAVMLVIAAVLRITIGNRDIKIRMIPFQILACILAVLEVGKQVCSLSRGYDLYHLPFHFCSLFIFMLPLMAFYNGKHRQTVTAITATVCTAMTLLMLVYPNLIYSAGNIREFFTDYFSFHTVAFHNIVVLECFLIYALDLHTPAPKGETRSVAIFTLCFCVAAATMSQLLQTNYANFYSCNIPPLENLRLAVRAAVGVVPSQLLYITIVTALHLLFVPGCYWLYRLARKCLAGKEVAAV